jgi:ATPase subunit of ABC transporter with duplicated ATPase domains
MSYEQWCASRITEAKVLAYLNRALKKQNTAPDRDEVAHVKRDSEFAYKGYSAAARRRITEKMRIPVPVHQAVLDNTPEKYPGYERLLRRKRSEYDTQNRPFAEMEEDPHIAEWLEQFILQWEGAILFISHDETLLERTANRILHLELLKKKKEAKHTICNTGYEEYVSSRQQQLTKQEQLAKNERNEYRAQQERLRRIEQKVAHQQNMISRQDPHGAALLKKKMRAVRSMAYRFEKEAAEMTEIPDTEEAIFLKFHGSERIPNGKNILQLTQKELRAGDELLAENIELWVKGREKICLIGKNGVGKTTLLKIIAEKLLERDDIHAAYMPQDYRDRMDFDRTPSEFLSQTGDKEELTRIHTFLGSLKFTAEEMNRPIRELSGGQKAKLFLLHLSMRGANVLILDEPTRNLSPLSNPVIRQLLKDFDGAIISVSHDRKYIAEVCDTVYELTKDGLSRRSYS